MTNMQMIKSAMRREGYTGKLARLRLARATGIHPALIGRYLSGECTIAVRNAPKLARVLGLSVQHVIYGDSYDHLDGDRKAV